MLNPKGDIHQSSIKKKIPKSKSIRKKCNGEASG
jgi:hypothetical protein